MINESEEDILAYNKMYKMNKIVRMNDGRLRMRITINSEQIPVYGYTESEIKEKACAKYEAAIKQEIEPSKERFDKSLLSYIQTYKVPKWAKSTLSRNMLLYRTHIDNKNIGKLKLGQIYTKDIQKLYNHIAENYSYSEIRRVKFLINPYFEYLLDVGDISKNPCKNAILPAESNCEVASKDMNDVILTEDDIRKFTELAPKYELKDNTFISYYHGLLVLLNEGIRCGELLALTWSNVDFETSLITIQVSTNLVSVTDKSGNKKTERIIKAPKTKAGIRQIAMSEQCRNSLLFLMGYQERHKIKNINNLVVCTSTGNYAQNKDLRNVLKRVLSDANINPNATIHGLRHSFGTYLYHKTKDIISIQRVMGHTDCRTTEKYYIHTQLSSIYALSNAFDIKANTTSSTKG